MRAGGTDGPAAYGFVEVPRWRHASTITVAAMGTAPASMVAGHLLTAHFAPASGAGDAPEHPVVTQSGSPITDTSSLAKQPELRYQIPLAVSVPLRRFCQAGSANGTTARPSSPATNGTAARPGVRSTGSSPSLRSPAGSLGSLRRKG